MSNFFASMSLCIFASFLGTAAATSQVGDKADKPVVTGPAPAQELKVLSALVGQWKTETTAKPSLVHKEGFTVQGELTCQWIHNGHYLVLEGRSLPKGGFESTEIIGFDRTAKQYRRFVFSTEGVMAQSSGDWDDKARTMTWKGVNLPDGWSVVAKHVLEKERMVFSLLVKNDKNEIVRDVILTARRQKPGEKDRPAQKDTEEEVKFALIQAKAILTTACKAYFLKHNDWPPNLEDLTRKSKLGFGPFVENRDALKDPWGFPYRYDPKGPKNGGRYPDIWTISPNGRTIGNWPVEQKKQDEDRKKNKKLKN